MIKSLVINHIQRAHKRYDCEKPDRKLIRSFLNSLCFDYPFLRFVSLYGQMTVGVPVRIFPYESFMKTPQAALPRSMDRILLNPEWAARLFYTRLNWQPHVAQDMKRIRAAAETELDLKFTLGHEMGHLTYDKGNTNILLPRKRKKFINWVNEVFADFYSAQFAMDANRAQVIATMQRKQKLRRKDTDTVYHPNWSKRIDYISNYDFSERLIERIAADCKVKERWLIDKVKRWYGFPGGYRVI